MFKFVLILSLCYIVVECNTIKRRGGCNKIFTCISPLNNLGPEDIKDFSNAAFYDQFCQKSQTFSSCFRDARVECDHQGVLNDYESLVGVADFLCTDESRDDVSFLINLECASSELKIVELVQSFEGCRLIFDNDMNLDFCPLMHQFSGCLVNIATEKCGSRAGGFVSRLFNVAAAAELGELGCGAQARNARRNIDTIFPLLAKAAKLRR
ncbi:uncharacterized protein LOC131927188 isoform X2 [Physella acuta]|uniref:uncharacterized protein LOC131927188 isoform X2 n=1 Tax=Physella acuta TaxID=109671 RepID=UPI0027DAC223|nr:uncharacterized protein LOC131927188 isoform X2 [Physella acuta]